MAYANNGVFNIKYKTHIKQKAKLIRELKAEVAVPYLVAVASAINNHVEKANEATNGLEQN